ncbi:DMT family transporter [Lignipirellula cremea]|uniref:Guanidinium exporter n=1 Tax=Lignipirellula cremea TaxID=2528010 RepID=A0A518DRE5_9BACT|nr:multidrug efflux SMR transporter [Lignipirellula cremea]QDU94415.1 Quaternary ammonium compound-resistance protein SugE [Lignipirellula cremea]
MAWVYLVVAGIFEVIWAVGLKYTEGFTRFWPCVFTIGAYSMSVVLLSFAVKHIPLGTGYAIWTGLGVIGVAICGVLLFEESITPWRIFFLAVVLVGMIGLKLTS